VKDTGTRVAAPRARVNVMAESNRTLGIAKKDVIVIIASFRGAILHHEIIGCARDRLACNINGRPEEIALRGQSRGRVSMDGWREE